MIFGVSPLVKVDNKRLTVVNTSLKLPNLLRCLG